MGNELILKNIARYIELNQEEEQQFIQLLKVKKIKKRQFLLHKGETAKFLAFVYQGCLKAYTIDDNGFEHILQFAPADWWITDLYSLLSGEQGGLNIDAIEDSEVLLLYREDQERLYHSIPKFERYFRILSEKSLIAHRQRVLDNMDLSAKDRYKKFCKVYPGLIHTLPQKLIASYIGVTPEFLSKIKNESLREK